MEGSGCQNWLDVSGPVRVFVPAGVRFKLRFMHSPGSPFVAVPDEQVLNLSPGETKDLGVLQFVPAGKPPPATSSSAPASQPASAGS